MATNVELADEVVEKARRFAAIERTTLAKQIELYVRLALIGENNPDLPFSLIREIMKADAEEATEEYNFYRDLKK